MKLFATRREEQNRAALDPWTVVHFASGLAAGLVRAPLSTAMGAAVGYEVIEQFAERRPWGRDIFHTTEPESLANVVADVAVFALGHRLGSAWTGAEGDEAGG